MGYNSVNRRESETNRWAVGSGGSFDIESGGEMDIESGGALKIAGAAMSRSAAEINLLVQGLAAGYKLARGSQAATASAVVATGLTTIVGFAVTPIGGTATKINTAAAISAAASAGNLTIKRWKHTGASTATLVAATTAGTVSWLAVGT